MASIKEGDCVMIPDGRIARVRDKLHGKYKVRVRRKFGATYEFILLPALQLKPVQCPESWMSPNGYNSYLRKTLAKMRKRR
jgi:hypothetical protein